jgi:Holliday junction resolvasome RuvABC endonuclease subunit
MISLISRSNRPDYLARELHNMNQFGSARALQHLTALIDLIAYEDDYLDDSKYAAVGPGTWKKFVAGNGSIKKDKQYVGKMVKACHEHPMFIGDLSNEKNDNILDAVGIGITAFAAISGYARVREAKSFVQLVEDSKKMCDYGKER